MDGTIGRYVVGMFALAGAVLAQSCAQEPTPAPLGVTNQAVVSGAGFTTDNIWVDGDSKDICKNSSINCNIYGAKQYVWLNGGPAANGLGPDGDYFFAVLVPGGQPDPNDGGAKNLSDDFDTYVDRTFAVVDGEVDAYGGPHDLDSGDFLDPGRHVCKNPHGCAPDGQPPLIRLAPYADTTNPGGVYIMAICSLADGYPVTPRSCKYDAFKVRKGLMTYDLMLSGIKFQDTYADGVEDDAATDPGLAGWAISILGTGFAGEPIDEIVRTDADGYWDFSRSYAFQKSSAVFTAELTVCEQLREGWYQSYPSSGCYTLSLAPSAIASVDHLDFGNWQPVSITACKLRDLDFDADTTDDRASIAGWPISLLEGGALIDTQLTGADGCYTWSGLEPSEAGYAVEEGLRAGWAPLGPTTVDFGPAGSGQQFQHTFVNVALEGCTPGFWQGGSDGGQAGGQWLWNSIDDPDWTASGGEGTNPYVWETLFNDVFAPCSLLDGLTMMDLVATGGGELDARKAGRSLVAAFLNASWGMGYPYDSAMLMAMWSDTVVSGEFHALHSLLDAANNAMYRTDGGERCPISASLK